MARNIFISFILLFVLSSSLSETIILVLKENKKEITNLDYENEKKEVEKELEIEEYTKTSQEKFAFSLLSQDQISLNYYLSGNRFLYKNPYFSNSTPPPKYI